jgi:hypothetical protein
MPIAMPCPAPAPPVPTTAVRPYTAPVPASAPTTTVRPYAAPLPASPEYCEAACGSCDKAKAYELVKAYHKACAAGDKDAATRCAVQALALDPTCFAPSK